MSSGVLDWVLTFFIVAGIFLLVYTMYRQQSILDTVNEIKEMFEDKIEDVKDMGGVYK